MPSGIESPHIIHPTTLDIVFHSLFAAMGNGRLDMQNAAVPIGLESLTVSMDLPTGGDARMKGFSKVVRGAGHDIVADIYVAGEQSDAPSVVVQGLRCRELPNGNAKSTSSEIFKAPIGYVVQKVDIDLLDAKYFAKHILAQETAQHVSGEEPSSDGKRIDSAITTVCSRVIVNGVPCC